MLCEPANPSASIEDLDSDGRFKFDTAEGAQGLIARSEAGYASGTILDLDSPTLVLMPWGRVEGTVRRGTKPLSNAAIRRSYAIAIPGRAEGAYFRSNLDAQTDALGQFILDRVPEGTLRLGVSPAGRRAGARLQELAVHGGATTSIVFGGQGRPVIGKLDPQVASDSRQIVLVPAASDPSGGPDLSKLPASERLAIERGMADSTAYRQSLAARRTPLVGELSADGTFRFEEVIAGTYALQATFMARGPRSIGTPALGERVATARADITIDPMPGGTTDEPLDLGSIPDHPRMDGGSGCGHPFAGARRAARRHHFSRQRAAGTISLSSF